MYLFWFWIWSTNYVGWLCKELAWELLKEIEWSEEQAQDVQWQNPLDNVYSLGTFDFIVSGGLESRGNQAGGFCLASYTRKADRHFQSGFSYPTHLPKSWEWRWMQAVSISLDIEILSCELIDLKTKRDSSCIIEAMELRSVITVKFSSKSNRNQRWPYKAHL